ncbi:uncharacterized protein LOC126720657 isoform X3 [Quercus robur]|uniref:uncharacterized protein LOC126720657 isoform X3 n=1 Tax=Quercus robur TaxID=38942 RepID=UPI002163240C|nr:uncharacterized protein LOC126720657 isoform X3 [Quercus robur]
MLKSLILTFKRLNGSGRVTALAYLSKATYQMLHSDAPWNVKKIELLANLSNSKLLELLNISSTKDMVIPKELRDIVSSPSYKVKQLKVEISKSFTTHEFIELVDSLLWISPRLELLLITHGEWIDKNWYRETISFKFSYEKPILGGENSSCCKFLPVPSWRHCLKSVMIENFRAFTNVETLKADEEFLEKYFYENANFLESFQFIPRAVCLNKKL